MSVKTHSNYRWVDKKAPQEKTDSLQRALKIKPSLCELLLHRNINTFDQAKKFFRPSLKDLHNPFLMKDMEIAIQRINDAIYYGEKILVYGDYDVDGTTAISLAYTYFKNFYDNIEYYVPNRYVEGYGVSYEAIDWAIDNKFGLVICLDCGIKAVDKIAYAKENGLDFIICDHHLPGDVLPPAVAVLDPKRDDCPYPFKELSGCGIGFKLAQAYSIFHRKDPKMVYELLDLVAVSVASDIVPIEDENRVLTYFGLEKLTNNPRPGLKSMIELSKLQGNIRVSDIVFVIGPRINAAGRMDDAKYAVKLLVADHNETAYNNAEILQKHNSDRKVVDTDITNQAISMVADNAKMLARKSTVLYKPDWHKGVIGIVASRLIQHFYRPTVVLTLSNGMVTGSARSVSGFDIYNALDSCSDLIHQFGGHKYAAGLTIEEGNVSAFMDRFENIVRDTITDDQLTPEILIDSEIPLKHINDKFYGIIKQFAPFGPANMRPVFKTAEVYDTGHSSIVGENHLKLVVRQKDSFTYKGIAYNMASKLDIVKSGKPFQICYIIEENNFKGSSNLQLNINDIKAL